VIYWIATTAMILDHVGALIYPSVWELRALGRISYPLFAWGVHQGMSKTKNPKAYLTRLAILAAVSEIVHHMAFGTWVSPVSMLLIGALLLQGGTRAQEIGTVVGLFLGPLGCMSALPAAWRLGPLPVGVLLVGAAGANWLQWFSLLAIPIALTTRQTATTWDPPKLIKYALYPAHLLVLLMARTL